MHDLFSRAAVEPAALPPAPGVGAAAAILAAARLLLPHLERGRRVDAAILRAAMEAAFGASDASGAWDWKSAYDACEATTVLFLRKYGKALFRKAGSPAATLPLVARVAGLLPTHTRRSAESEAFQQLSTPAPLGLAALTAAAVTPADRVLEPSAGTGLLAVLAEIAGGALILNELAEARALLLSSLFPAAPVTRFDAAQIDDRLDPASVPGVVLMNPPFSAMANVSGRRTDAALRHVASALARVAEGGRLVAITGAGFAPNAPAWRDAFVRLQERGRVVFTAAIDGRVYAKHGTTVETRLTVIDKVPAEDPAAFPASLGVAPDVATLLGWIGERMPPRSAIATPAAVPVPSAPKIARGGRIRATAAPFAKSSLVAPEAVDLAYETVDWAPEEGARLTDAIYEAYALQTIRIPGAQPHPTKLVQSAAMASVAPPKPGYLPRLPARLVTEGILSDAQLETVIYAGEAHSGHLAGAWTVDAIFDLVSAAPEDAEGAVRFRRGFMLGDGTGAGKGRQAAAILLDNWLRGRRKALWVSKSDKLIEDARRDWSALGMERLLVTPLSRFAQGRPIALREGVLFTTYATLRSDERGEKVSRVTNLRRPTDDPSPTCAALHCARRHPSGCADHVNFCSPFTPIFVTLYPCRGGGRRDARPVLTETAAMIILAVFGSLAAIGGLCLLVFNLAVFAVPAFGGVNAGLWAHETGAGVLGAVVVGLVAAGAVFGLRQFLLAVLRPMWLKLVVALAFAAPAVVAGYHATHGVVKHLMPSETWQTAFSIAGAIAVGVTAFVRLTAIAPPGSSGRGVAGA